jgi:hypothetical protein
MGLGQGVDDFELVVDVDERAMQGAQDGQRVRVLGLVRVERRRLAGDVDLQDLLVGQRAVRRRRGRRTWFLAAGRRRGGRRAAARCRDDRDRADKGE